MRVDRHWSSELRHRKFEPSQSVGERRGCLCSTPSSSLNTRCVARNRFGSMCASHHTRGLSQSLGATQKVPANVVSRQHISELNRNCRWPLVDLEPILTVGARSLHSHTVRQSSGCLEPHFSRPGCGMNMVARPPEIPVTSVSRSPIFFNGLHRPRSPTR